MATIRYCLLLTAPRLDLPLHVLRARYQVLTGTYFSPQATHYDYARLVLSLVYHLFLVADPHRGVQYVVSLVFRW